VRSRRDSAQAASGEVSAERAEGGASCACRRERALDAFLYARRVRRVACTVGAALVGIVTFGSLAGSMLPFILKRMGFDPASASAPFVATLVDVTGLVIYFSIALIFLRGTLL
jgi:magnesium transporter